MLGRKTGRINAVIAEQLNTSRKPMLSLSWGKDSYLLLHFVLQHKADIAVVYLDSGYGLPDNYRFRDNILAFTTMNYIELQQDIDYIAFCKQFKLPHHRTVAEQKKAVAVLKKDQLDRFASRNGYDLIFWGLRADESRGRFNLAKNGYWFDKANGIRYCHPLIYMKQFELWYTYEILGLPVNEIYKKTTGIITKEQIRNSGYLSTDGANYGRIQWLRDFYPEEYSRLLYYFPESKLQSR